MASKNFKKYQRRPVRRAFTLMEIIVVVTIIALLATLVGPRLIGQVSRAKESKAKSEVRAIGTAVTMYVTDTGTTLNDGFDLDLLLAPPKFGITKKLAQPTSVTTPNRGWMQQEATSSFLTTHQARNTLALCSKS